MLKWWYGADTVIFMYVTPQSNAPSQTCGVSCLQVSPHSLEDTGSAVEEHFSIAGVFCTSREDGYSCCSGLDVSNCVRRDEIKQ